MNDIRRALQTSNRIFPESSRGGETRPGKRGNSAAGAAIEAKEVALEQQLPQGRVVLPRRSWSRRCFVVNLDRMPLGRPAPNGRCRGLRGRRGCRAGGGRRRGGGRRGDEGGRRTGRI